MFSFGSEGLPALGPIKVTIDNIRIVSKNPSVPWKGSAAGEVTVNPEDGTFTLVATGVAAHLDAFTETVKFGPDGLVGDLEIVVANGDKLIGKMYNMGPLEVVIEDGTGRFKGVKGSSLESLYWPDTEGYQFTSTSSGWISNLGVSH